MPDTQKPVEEPTAAAAAPAAADPAPASEPAATTSDEITSTTEAPPAAPAKEESKAEENKDAAETAEPPKPLSEGLLGYKGPGLVKGFRFSDKHIWFGDEAVESKDLNSYLHNEKPNVAHPVVAWSTQTGKGLLYFAKTPEQKAQPTHVIKLADISDVFTEGFYEFHFKVNGQKHSFRTQVEDERDAWVKALKEKSAEAKEMVESIIKSEGYTDSLEKLGKPAVGAPAAKTESTPKKSTEKAPEGVKRGDASGSEGEAGEKKRSVSRKRGSIFAFMGKREDAEEKKDKEKKEDKEDKPEESAAAAAEPAAEPAKTEEPAPAAATAAVEEATEQAAEPKDAPKPSKRASIFGSIMRKRETAGPAEDKKEATSAAPAKDTEATPASEPVDVPAKPAESAEETAASPTSASTSPKKGGVLSFFKKERGHAEKKEGEEEVEAAPKANEPAAPATEAAQPATDTETPAPAGTATETTESATATEQPKTRRRSSFFTDLYGKVAKKPGDVTSDSETEPKEKTTTPNKLQGLFRGKSHRESKKGESKKEATPPPAVEEAAETATESKDAAPAAEPKPEETLATSDTAAATAVAAEPSQTNAVNGTIGDVVGDAITVGQTPVQAAA
ncbi:hypothetical protein GP486_007690 [Trichoglossum hirsutum]|uniref:Meiotic expression up-regulated protein 6 PH domain-containing protein n=1 Tax=Trichoglossum hirsutum TaxID=265104 RepID=A0A9P8L4P5_9PEZI|nr:hypothetical protein GP486_007690 [Trichoglossum hirsutum]